MRRGVSLWSACAVVIAITAAPARADSIPVLGADNVLSAPASGSVEVRIPEATGIHAAIFANQSVALTGTGPVYGFVLRSLPVSATSVMVTVLRVGDGSSTCGGPCGANDGLRVYGWYGPEEDRFYKLPAGRYLWSAITEGGTVRASLHLANLSGSLELSPTAPFAARALDIPAQPGERPGSEVFAQTATLSTRGMIFTEMATAQGGIDFGKEHCVFRGAVGPSAFEPGCPGSAYDAAAGSSVSSWALLDVPAGVWSVGGNTSGVDSQTTAVAAWIPLYVSPTPPAPPAPPTPPGGSPEVPAPASRVVRMRVVRRVLSARSIRRAGKVRIAVRSDGSLTNVTGSLTAGRRVYARGRLGHLQGAGTLRLALDRRVSPGSYRLSLQASDARGKKVVLSLRMVVTR